MNEKKYNAHDPVRLSFGEVLSATLEQIDAGSIDEDEGQVREIALIMADVYMLDRSATVMIGGQARHAGDVQDMYREVGAMQVTDIIEAFNRVDYEVRNIKAYLRTAIYNAALTAEHRFQNSFRRNV